ncbi:HlyD family type I secretion periplasmic adaptor subunit [Litorimonas cladophorae]|uniref:Membrane fusion protein (MFP) family protein n=1 Tax=Litorimonas cladophorae TaxID=1220491 RepID=A0A918KFU2_9PROT|nr:HlyD family type I secretion periplasmic adaptor subunit [Litorimonas cladophorae]GGX62085.1 HlyD family type I secretion periplasmic adaptor subunit [Litorimonas cladophorae]
MVSSSDIYSMLWKSKTIKLGALICTFAFGGFLVWASLAPLAEGVIVYGTVAVENNRKTIQHLEGGIIQEILVREGDVVETGAPLMILTDVSVAAGRDQIAKELANAEATIDRLEALLSNKSKLIFRDLEQDIVPENVLMTTRSRQHEFFAQQRGKIKADIDVLESRRAGLLQRAENHEAQIESTRRARDLVQADVERSQKLLEQRLIRALDLSGLERDEARLSSDLARLKSEQNTAVAQADEITQQIIQTRAQFTEQLSADLVAARAEILSNRERLISAQDVVNRTILYAPQSGEILNLAFSNAGAVVRPGETILEIVPDNQDLIATAEIQPSDRDSVYEGLSVEARLSGLKAWDSPLLAGTISDISADLKTSADGRYSYYEAQITIGEEKLGELTTPLLPGMPIEAFIFSGEKRTFLEYLLEPVNATMRKAARE